MPALVVPKTAAACMWQMVVPFALHAAILNKKRGLSHGWFRKRAKCERDGERGDKRAAEGEPETTSWAYVNTGRKSMCVDVHVCVLNHISAANVAYTDAGRHTFCKINTQYNQNTPRWLICWREPSKYAAVCMFCVLFWPLAESQGAACVNMSECLSKAPVLGNWRPNPEQWPFTAVCPFYMGPCWRVRPYHWRLPSFQEEESSYTDIRVVLWAHPALWEQKILSP